ncbi:Na+/H+ antiporter subunit G [Denitrificimonas sp. JX-1]|uniref:Na+/H+ antiporter subunit G n=1 Tax=Denitrificimonas halotolerans TaxID=3098930 RepID=A0ABU5GPA2_9GAMM|nr:Na+/H+ antiporter subunit G [Denitrificimonas sp. JX-1]MDY7218829.1 Na+/H+ antiporter subunit G [Denitrificimonas sp. JX-1]
MVVWVEYTVAFFLLVGSAFALVGSIGLYRFPDFYMRLHGPAKATTLGVGCVLIASIVYFSSRDEGLHVHELLITLFLMLSAPVSAYMMAKAAVQQQVKTFNRKD